MKATYVSMTSNSDGLPLAAGCGDRDGNRQVVDGRETIAVLPRPAPFSSQPDVGCQGTLEVIYERLCEKREE